MYVSRFASGAGGEAGDSDNDDEESGARTLFMLPSRRAYSSSTSCSSGVSDSASGGYEACEAERGWSGLSVAMVPLCGLLLGAVRCGGLGRVCPRGAKVGFCVYLTAKELQDRIARIKVHCEKVVECS
jgi:hypothetical protein